MAHRYAQRLCGDKARQHAADPIGRADLLCRPRPLAPRIDVGEEVLDEGEVSPAGMKGGTDVAQGRRPSGPHLLLRAGPPIPHDLVPGEPRLRRFLQRGDGREPIGAQDDPVGLGHLDPQPGCPLVNPRHGHCQVLHRKAVLGRLDVEDGNSFPPIVIVGVDMGDFPALELRHAPGALAQEPDLGGTLIPIVERGIEDIRKHASL